MRLEKYLVNCGVGSRREIREMVAAARIQVNERTALHEREQVLEEDAISLDGELLAPKILRYYLLYKKAGYITAVKDDVDPVVMDLLPDWVETKALFPVGRLDKDTEGLLLFTNDGDLNYRMTQPHMDFPKTYYAELDRSLSLEDMEKLEGGIDIGTHLCQPAKVKKLTDSSVHITISEGKFHQVKKMFRAVNNKVNYLKRISFGNLNLEGLEKGEVRELQRSEIQI